MGKKNLTQVQLEKRVRELEKELDQVKRALKRSIKQLSKYEAYVDDVDVEQPAMQPSQVEEKPKENDTFEVTLPDGTVKKIKKRF